MPKKILVIEDDQFFREMLAQTLAKEGYEVFQAADGQEGLKKTQEVKPDLVLLDVILPKMNGFEVLSDIREDPATSSIPVIILSNLDQEEEREKAKELKAVDYLVKARSLPEDIIEKIKNALK